MREYFVDREGVVHFDNPYEGQPNDPFKDLCERNKEKEIKQTPPEEEVLDK